MRLHFYIITLFCFSLCGCGTIGARATTENPPPFAGLKADFGSLGQLYSDEGRKEVGGLWVLTAPLVSGIILADIPVSLVFDAYCLPTDLSRQKKQPAEEETKVEVEKGQLIDGSNTKEWTKPAESN